MPYAILRFQKRKAGGVAACERHNERKKEAYKSNPDIDMERSKDNYHLVNPPRYTYKKEINRMVAEAGCRTRKDLSLIHISDMFTKRTIKPHQAVAVVDTASEALAVSISEKACVDMGYMSQLTGKTKEELAGELQGVIFRVPGQLEQDGSPHYVTADEYLSGNVRRKLRQAQRAAQQDPVYAVNVEALTAAQPKDLDASEIEVRLGATWIDKKYIQQFMYETFNLSLIHISQRKLCRS